MFVELKKQDEEQDAILVMPEDTIRMLQLTKGGQRMWYKLF
jgi:hypothetical protein